MFDDLDATLAAMLDDPAAPSPVRTAEVSFAVPDKTFAPTQATLNLFLHEVEENRALRDDTPVTERVAQGYLTRRPAVRVDCTYLVTAWSTKTGGLQTAEEHEILGLTLQWLCRFPVLDTGHLQGLLQSPPQPYPVIVNVAQRREGQSIGEFWTALGIAPRPALSLTVTLAAVPFPETRTDPQVTAVQLRSGLVGDPVLRGRVLTSALDAVPEATVQLVEAGRSAGVDALGGFSFTDVPFGAYTLTVQTAGSPDTTKHVDYAADAQVHDVILTGP
ncbi:Pvc16 family protein [Kribbella sp. NPDC000426]|uniref:Pvc16 family protein n=1 Tax=Kribbella sp. NPDC000426 TaxID=3154255 RepID=UPI0033346EFD